MYMARWASWNTVDPLWPMECAYGYINGSPVSLSDPSGNGSNFGPCTVYSCSEHKFPNWIASHKFSCVRGPNGGCSGGMYPVRERPFDFGKIGNRNEKRPPDPKDNPNKVTCVVLSTDCTIASAVCEAIRRDVNNPPFYSILAPLPPFTENCYIYPVSVLCEACTYLPILSQKYWLCKAQCSWARLIVPLPFT
jgi:hypothetical protein